MGGTFDPIHNGHLMLANAAYEAFHLDEVWFMPNGNPPHKKSSTIEADVEDRVRMVDLAIREVPYFRQRLHRIPEIPHQKAADKTPLNPHPPQALLGNSPNSLYFPHPFRNLP